MKNKCLLIASLLVIVLSFFVQKEVFAVIADPNPINFKQPDGSVVTIKLKGDERFSWAETLDGYTLLSDGKNGWAYAILNAVGDLVSSGILTHNQSARTPIELSLLSQIPKKLQYSQKQIEDFKSSTDARLKSATAANAFTPTGSKKLLLILIDFTDQPFNSPLTAHADFNGLLNTVGYSANNTHGSVHDFFYETSYGNFDLTTDVVGPFHAAHDMAYYGENVGSNHSPKAGELVTEAVLAADPYVNYADYANVDGTVEGVYVVYAGYGEATSGLTYTIWPHASTIPTQTLDGVKVSRYSCSNELTAGGTDMTTIGVICHEFGHVCGAPDFYDTDYDTNGQFDGTGYWDVMANGVYDGTPSGSLPPHFNPYVKALFGWATPTELTTSQTRTVADITTNAKIYKVNSKTSGEYFLIENRQQTGFNADIPGHGLMIYHKNAGEYNTDKNMKHPQGFYPVCANSTIAIPNSDPVSYGDINSDGCPFPGSSGKRAFYDTGIPSAKSWAGVNTDMPITNITENVDGTVSFTITPLTVCGSEPSTQATSFLATPTVASSMNISWTRGNGDKVLVLAREGSVVDFDPLSGTTYTANASFKSGEEVGTGNYVVYNGTGTSVTLTGLNGNTQYFLAVYEYNSATNCYLKPALTGNGTTNCTYDPLTFTEDFERSSFGCWTVVDNQGNGQVWKLGTYSTAANQGFTGNYAYLPCAAYGSGNAQNSDLISPAFDLSGYTSVALKFNHYYKSYTGTSARVSYSIDNGATWTLIKTYSATTSNPEAARLSVNAAAGHSQVKFKWNFTSTNWGFYWSIDDISIKENVDDPSNFAANTTSTSQINLNWNKNAANSDVLIAWSPTSTFGIPTDGTAYSAGNTLPSGGGTVLYKGSLSAFNHTLLTINTTYFYRIWSVNGSNQYSVGLTPISATTDCTAISTLPYSENFDNPDCWRRKDNTGDANWQFGTTSNVNYTPALTGNYAYFKSAYGVAHNYNADLISPTFDLSAYGGVMLSFSHLFDASGSYPSTGKVYYSIDNGLNWTQLASYSSDSPNPEVVNLGICAVAGQANVKFKWTYSCSPTGAYLWAVDDVSISETSGIWTGTASTDWHTASNWCNNTIPTATTNVFIPTGVSNMPYISSITIATCKDITLQTGTTLKMAANTELDVKGNWVNNGNYDYTNSINSALVKFNGTSAQNYSGSTVLTLRKFEVDNTSGITIQKELRADNIALKNGIVLTTGTAKLNLYGGTLTKTNGYVNGTLQKYLFTNPSAQKIVSFEIGDASNYIPVQITFPIGSITGANGLALKNTTGDYSNIASSTLNSGKSVNRYWSFPYNGITFSSCDIVFNYLSSDLDASVNTANLIAGKYTASAWTYPIVGLKTSTSTQITGISSFGDFQLAENFGKTSTGGNWSADASWSPSGVPVATDNVLILSPGTVVVDVTNAVCQELAVQSGAKLQIDPAKALTITNTLTNNSIASGVTIKSDATGTGSLIAGSTSGQATVESYLTANKWHIVSPTAEGGSTSAFIQAPGNAIPSKAESYGMMDYNETGNSWNSYYTSSTLENLTSGKGYSVRRTADGVVTFIGTLTSGTKTVNLTKIGTEGWNCVGNPYSSSISINTAANATNNFLKTNAIDASNLDASYACIYVWDQDASGYKILGNVSYDLRDLGQNIFQSGQGFFVKANNSGSSIEFTPAMQIHQPNAILKSAETSWPGFELTATNAQTKASTMVAFNNSMTNGLDPTYDAGLLRGTSGLNLYTHLVDDNGVDFAIQCLPENYNSLVIPVGVDSKSGGEITFSAETVELPATCSVIFEDKLAKTFTSLANGATYKATVLAGTTTVGRFYIHTSNSTTGTSELTAKAFSLKAYPANGKILIVGEVALGAKASLFDVNGRNLGTFNLQEGSRNSISSAGLATGVYLLNVTEASKRFNTKIVIY